jgi:DUF4097 and DUF4098 domain-containing protein YvlB
MKSLVVRLSLAALAFTVALLPARAEEWSKTYNISGRPDLRVETSDANIRVTSWDQNTIEAKVITTHYKIGEGGIRVEERQTGDSVEIDVHYPHHNFNVEWGSHKVDIIIQMPREGKVNLRTGDGKIEVAGLKGDMDLHTGDGSINLDGVDGKLHATTGDGHIQASGRFDELGLKTGDGHVDVRPNGSSLAAAGGLDGRRRCVSPSPERLAADVDLHTSDGHIDLDMPVTTEGKFGRMRFATQRGR